MERFEFVRLAAWIAAPTSSTSKIMCMSKLRGPLLALSDAQNIFVINVETKHTITTLVHNAMCLVWLDDGKLVSWGLDRNIKLWDVEKEKCVSTLGDHAGCSVRLEVLPDGRLASYNPRRIKLWDVKTGTCVKIPGGATVLAALPGNRLAVAFLKTIKVWDLATLKVAHLSTDDDAEDEDDDDDTEISSLAVLPDGVLASSDDGIIKLWDLDTMKCKATWRADDFVKHLVVLPG